MKIGFVSSSGGHWEELLCLHEIADKNDSFYVTEKGGQENECTFSNLYVFRQINRKERLFIIHFLWVSLRTLIIMLKEQPDIIITTGALISFPFCIVSKFLRKKVIYIESFARVYDGSLTGKLVYPFADLFIVQWESMINIYPNAKYTGGIF